MVITDFFFKNCTIYSLQAEGENWECAHQFPETSTRKSHGNSAFCVRLAPRCTVLFLNAIILFWLHDRILLLLSNDILRISAANFKL